MVAAVVAVIVKQRLSWYQGSCCGVGIIAAAATAAAAAAADRRVGNGETTPSKSQRTHQGKEG